MNSDGNEISFHATQKRFHLRRRDPRIEICSANGCTGIAERLFVHSKNAHSGWNSHLEFSIVQALSLRRSGAEGFGCVRFKHFMLTQVVGPGTPTLTVCESFLPDFDPQNNWELWTNL